MEALNKSPFSYTALEKLVNQGNLMMEKQKIVAQCLGFVEYFTHCCTIKAKTLLDEEEH